MSCTYVFMWKNRGVQPSRSHEGPDGEYKYNSNLSLSSAQDGVVGQRPTPAALLPGMTRYPSNRRLVVVRTGLDGCGKSRNHRDSITWPSSPWRVAIPTELFRPTSLHVMLPIFLPSYYQICVLSTDFRGSPRYQISSKSSSGIYSDRQTDGMTNSAGAFRDCRNAPQHYRPAEQHSFVYSCLLRRL
jgi:hypothetical protein